MVTNSYTAHISDISSWSALNRLWYLSWHSALSSATCWCSIGAPPMLACLVLMKWVTFQYLVITSFRTDLILVSGWRTTGAKGDACYQWQLLIQTCCQCGPHWQLHLQKWLPHISRAGQGLSKRVISWCRDRARMWERQCNGWSIMEGPQ